MKEFKVNLYDNQNNLIYETYIEACNEDHAIELAWDEYCGSGYGVVDEVNE